MKKRLPIIIIVVLVVVFAGLGFYSHQKSKIKYNTSYVNGNTAGGKDCKGCTAAGGCHGGKS